MTYTIPDYAKPYVPQAQTDWQLFDSICYAIKGTSTEEEAAFGLRFMDWWRTINIECFESRLQPLFISREVSSYGHWIGLCQYRQPATSSLPGLPSPAVTTSKPLPTACLASTT
jgi:hypothetical protein